MAQLKEYSYHHCRVDESGSFVLPLQKHLCVMQVHLRQQYIIHIDVGLCWTTLWAEPHPFTEHIEEHAAYHVKCCLAAHMFLERARWRKVYSKHRVCAVYDGPKPLPLRNTTSDRP